MTRTLPEIMTAWAAQIKARAEKRKARQRPIDKSSSTEGEHDAEFRRNIDRRYMTDEERREIDERK